MYADLFVDQGADFTSNLDLEADDGTPTDVTGFTFAGALAKSYYSANVSANLTINVADSTNGNLYISLNSSTTSNLTAGKYVYDVKLTDIDGQITRILEGIITVTPRVTP